MLKRYETERWCSKILKLRSPETREHSYENIGQPGILSPLVPEVHRWVPLYGRKSYNLREKFTICWFCWKTCSLFSRGGIWNIMNAETLTEGLCDESTLLASQGTLCSTLLQLRILLAPLNWRRWYRQTLWTNYSHVYVLRNDSAGAPIYGVLQSDWLYSIHAKRHVRCGEIRGKKSSTEISKDSLLDQALLWGKKLTRAINSHGNNWPEFQKADFVGDIIRLRPSQRWCDIGLVLRSWWTWDWTYLGESWRPAQMGTTLKTILRPDHQPSINRWTFALYRKFNTSYGDILL